MKNHTRVGMLFPKELKAILERLKRKENELIVVVKSDRTLQPQGEKKIGI